ncbi:MAG: glycoside hydrolase family 13 protein [Cetobacterium sp.]|uniref:glycoside hydrolase family 13 protein n=2 Tax=Cetobacterium sp. TaxID=2071632 RepID=UPI003EE7EF45
MKRDLIDREGVLHIPKSNYAYAYNQNTLHIRIRTKKGDVDKVYLRIGDPYNWEEGGLDGGNLNGAEASGWIGGENVSMKKELSTEYHDYWFCQYKPARKRVRYAFILENYSERILFGEKIIDTLTKDIKENEWELSNISNFFSFPYLNKKDILDVPHWAKNTIWYQIFPERFCNGKPENSPKNVEPWGSKPKYNNFMGGDLYGLYDKIDYLVELGITGIYLCPIFISSTNHKYDTIDYYKIDPHFGDEDIFKKIVERCHSKGVKVMLDAVFNHVSIEFPFWKDVIERESNSKYADWFVINKFPLYEENNKINYETFANVKEMPKLNLENLECREYFLKVACYWVEKFNIDAWRLDVCNEIDHKFWREFRERIKHIKKDFYILGEIWHDALPWLMGDQFDAVMNYPLSDAIIKFLLSDKKLEVEKFIYDLNKILISYPKNTNEVTFNLLDSHDTSRVLTSLKEDKDLLKIALLLLFFQSGSPCLYYGTEIGMSGEKNSFSENNRKCMVWEDDKQDRNLFKFIQKLIGIRKNNKEFETVDVQWLLDSKRRFLKLKKGLISLVINLEDSIINLNIHEIEIKNNSLDLFKDEILTDNINIEKFLLIKEE